MFNFLHLFYGEDIKETNAAIKLGYDNANSIYKRKVFEMLTEYCKTHKEPFTVNNLRPYLVALRHEGYKTHDNRVMGGIMRKALSKRLIQKIGYSIKSKVGHGTSLQVYKSL